MAVIVQQQIDSPVSDVWNAVTDIQNAPQRLSAVIKVEILEQPQGSLVGLKWRETRKMFGKEATETMWVTRAEPNRFYETKALNAGCEYKTTVAVAQAASGTQLSMRFEARPITLMAHLTVPIGWLFRGMIRKALQNDALEIKKSLEG